MLAVRKRCRLLGRARRFGAHGEERGGGISWAARLQLVVITSAKDGIIYPAFVGLFVVCMLPG